MENKRPYFLIEWGGIFGWKLAVINHHRLKEKSERSAASFIISFSSDGGILEGEWSHLTPLFSNQHWVSHWALSCLASTLLECFHILFVNMFWCQDGCKSPSSFSLCLLSSSSPFISCASFTACFLSVTSTSSHAVCFQQVWPQIDQSVTPDRVL